METAKGTSFFQRINEFVDSNWRTELLLAVGVVYALGGLALTVGTQLETYTHNTIAYDRPDASTSHPTGIEQQNRLITTSGRHGPFKSSQSVVK